MAEFKNQAAAMRVGENIEIYIEYFARTPEGHAFWESLKRFLYNQEIDVGFLHYVIQNSVPVEELNEESLEILPWHSHGLAYVFECLKKGVKLTESSLTKSEWAFIYHRLWFYSLADHYTFEAFDYPRSLRKPGLLFQISNVRLPILRRERGCKRQVVFA